MYKVNQVDLLVGLQDYVVALAVYCIALAHGDVSSRLSERIGTAFNLQPAHDAPAVKMFVVKAQIARRAKQVERLLHRARVAKVTIGVVVADIFRANVSERRKLLTTVFRDLRHAALDVDQRKLAVMMPDS